MTCAHPVWLGKGTEAYAVSCGRCAGCRVNRAESWVTRLTHELDYWPQGGLFLTLTYEKMPIRGSLEKRELVLFFKRIRKELSKEKRKIKYYACGEYGGTFERPHYHAIVFGIGKNDCKWSRALGKYTCPIVETSWNKGIVDVGSVTPASMRYVANYIGKSFMGESVKIYNDREIPFSIMSKGMGLQWAIDNYEQLSTTGLKKEGKDVKIPRYYFKKLELDVPREYILEQWAVHRDRVIASGDGDVNYWTILESMEEARNQANLNLKGRESIRNKNKEIF